MGANAHFTRVLVLVSVRLLVPYSVFEPWYVLSRRGGEVDQSTNLIYLSWLIQRVCLKVIYGKQTCS